MKFFKLARRIRTEEDGAVTVDFVVLTAAVCALAAVGITYIKTGVSTLGSNIGTTLGGATVSLAAPANP